MRIHILTLLLSDVSVQFQSNQRAVAGRTFQLVGLDSQLPRRSFQLPRRTWTPFQFKTFIKVKFDFAYVLMNKQ